MSSIVSNLNEEKYLSYIYGSAAVNEYFNPHLITLIFSTSFPYRIDALEL